jgi:hypothetical protein
MYVNLSFFYHLFIRGTLTLTMFWLWFLVFVVVVRYHGNSWALQHGWCGHSLLSRIGIRRITGPTFLLWIVFIWDVPWGKWKIYIDWNTHWFYILLVIRAWNVCVIFVGISSFNELRKLKTKKAKKVIM